MQKNIVYGKITAAGHVHIDDKIYVVEQDFSHSILFLRVEKGTSGYEAMLSVKSDNDVIINLLQETVEVRISSPQTPLYSGFTRKPAAEKQTIGNRTRTVENY